MGGPLVTTCLQGHDARGRFAASDPAAVEFQKTRVLEELAAGKGLLAASQAAGVASSTLWWLRERDPEFAEAIDHWRRGFGLECVARMQDIVRNPEANEAGLKYASWANLLMINAKTAFPDMRDAAQVQVNVGVQVGDIDKVAERYYEQHPERR